MKGMAKFVNATVQTTAVLSGWSRVKRAILAAKTIAQTAAVSPHGP
jgi:hypothetical protein